MSAGDDFRAELLAAVPAGHQKAVQAVLDGWAGQTIYLNQKGRLGARMRAAKCLIDSRVHRAEAVWILAERFGVSTSQARRIYSRALKVAHDSKKHGPPAG